MKTLFAVLACAFSMAALAAPPPAPFVNVAATDIRQLEFTWEPVSGAQTYELWFRSAVGAPWAKFGERDARRSPNWRIAVPVHLLNWAGANYQIKACNSGGCTASNSVGVNGEKLAAIGFFKPQSAGADVFGGNLALSEDGNTLAVTAREDIGTARDSAVVYVYRKTTATSGWRREARLVPLVQNSTWLGYFGDSLSISADGNTLALGEYNEDSSVESSGAVYVWRRTGTSWALSQKLLGAGVRADEFGRVTKIDEAGRTLAVSHNYEGARFSGPTEIYKADAAGAPFVHFTTLTVPSSGDEHNPNYCNAFTLSGDGNTLVRTCGGPMAGAAGLIAYFHTAPGYAATSTLDGIHGAALNYDGTVMLSPESQGYGVHRLGSAGWQREGFLGHGDGFLDDGLSPEVALSHDGNFAAIGNHAQRSTDLGPVDPPYHRGSQDTPSGGVLIYQHKASGWELRRLVKPGSTNWGYAGLALDLGANGNVLAVGAPRDPSNASGIDGDRDDASAVNRGAVWLY